MRELLGRHNQAQRKNSNGPIAEVTLKRERDVRLRTTRAEGSETLPPAASWLLAGYTFARLPAFAKATTSGGLRVGSPSDPLEREADLVADRVMQPESAGGVGLSMRPDGESDTVRRTSYDPYSMEEGRIVEEDEERLQPKAEAGPTVSAGPAASGGPFSFWGEDVPAVLSDDGWKRGLSCVAKRNDILVFAAGGVAHTGIVNSVAAPGANVDENMSQLDSKWGQLALNRSSWTLNVNEYGRYFVFSKSPNLGPCAAKGANEG